MDQFEKIKKIGKGNYGQILLVKDKTNEKVHFLYIEFIQIKFSAIRSKTPITKP